MEDYFELKHKSGKRGKTLDKMSGDWISLERYINEKFFGKKKRRNK